MVRVNPSPSHFEGRTATANGADLVSMARAARPTQSHRENRNRVASSQPIVSPKRSLHLRPSGIDICPTTGLGSPQHQFRRMVPMRSGLPPMVHVPHKFGAVFKGGEFYARPPGWLDHMRQLAAEISAALHGHHALRMLDMALSSWWMAISRSI